MQISIVTSNEYEKRCIPDDFDFNCYEANTPVSSISQFLVLCRCLPYPMLNCPFMNPFVCPINIFT